MKKLIKSFLKEFGTKARKNESESYTELMMDDHICIDWEDKQYYVPENNSSYTEDDDLIWKFLNECFHV